MLTNEKPDWFHGSQEEWDQHIKLRKKAFMQHPFSYRSYIKDSENIQKIKHFVKCIKQGDLPDDDILSWMADKLELYTEGRSPELDRAFGLLSKPKKGNPVAQYNAEIEKNGLLNEMAEILVKDESISKIKAAEIVLARYNYGMEAETLRRYFKDWPAREHAIELFKARARMQADK